MLPYCPLVFYIAFNLVYLVCFLYRMLSVCHSNSTLHFLISEFSASLFIIQWNIIEFIFYMLRGSFFAPLLYYFNVRYDMAKFHFIFLLEGVPRVWEKIQEKMVQVGRANGTIKKVRTI